MATTKRLKRCALRAGHAGSCLVVSTTKPSDPALGECVRPVVSTKMIFDRDMMGMQILRVVPCSTT